MQELKAFEPHELDAFGSPLWLTAVANHDDPNHLVHVVRGVDAAYALTALGVSAYSIVPCNLPEQRPKAGISLPRAALHPVNPMAALLAAQIGEWTFIYDDLGYTLFPQGPQQTGAQLLSAAGTAAATSYWTVTGDQGFLYAIGGRLLVDEMFLTESRVPAGAPPELRAAVSAADVGGADLRQQINMRVISALAGIPSTLEELRELSLFVAPVD
ncbi:hypothetical protein [Streptomyces sp. NPDC020681]|uniref:hypothetical protein n=1 Tax=Streptomyces sp. NPDC020681 TaxID=3365083 RepID=UPI003796A266